MVLDLRHVNSFLVHMGVKYETLKRLQLLSRPNDWAVSFDISDGFHCCQIAPEHRQYLTFQLQGKLYRACVLPFGLSSSPAVFTKIMAVLTRLLRNPTVPTTRDQLSPAHWLRLRDQLLRRTPVEIQGCRMLPFMDDFLALYSSRLEALRGRELIRA